MRNLTLLTVIARIHPEVWDVVHDLLGSRTDLASLNPQPLPPIATFQADAAEMARGLVDMAVETEVRGGSASDTVREFVDEWCGTPWPHRWPMPWPGPDPDGPSPEPWDVRTARVIGAVVLASAGARLPAGDLGATFAKGAEQLAEAALTA